MMFHRNNKERLRTLYDLVETHYRGLFALRIDENTYSCVVDVVPKLLEKIPEDIRLNMTLGSEEISGIEHGKNVKGTIK